MGFFSFEFLAAYLEMVFVNMSKLRIDVCCLISSFFQFSGFKYNAYARN